MHPSDGVAIKVISGESHGESGFVRPVGGCWFFDVKLSKPGATVFQPLPEGWTGFAYGEYSVPRLPSPSHALKLARTNVALALLRRRN